MTCIIPCALLRDLEDGIAELVATLPRPAPRTGDMRQMLDDFGML